MRQFTKEEAITFAESNQWEPLSFRERALLQFSQKLLCMPFDKFHEATEKALGRPVFTHEFGLNYDGLIAELLGRAPMPSFEDIINLIPREKRVIVIGGEE